MIAVELLFRQLMDAVRQLSPSEKLELNEMIWNDDITIPVEHQELVNERIRKANANSELLQDWDKAAKSLRS